MAKYTHFISSTNCNNSKENNHGEYVQKIQKRMPLILGNPIIQEFLKNEEHQLIMSNTFKDPSPNNSNLLNEKFKKFYQINRIERYCSVLIKERSINFDKKRKKHINREVVILDKPARIGPSGEVDTLGSLWEGKETTEVESVDSIIDQQNGILPVKNKQLEKAIRALSEKQNKILFYRFQKQYTNREIAKLLGETEQNVGYWLKKTIKQIKESL